MPAKKQNYWLQTIEKVKPEISSLLPAVVEDKEKFFQNTSIAVKRDPNLLKYTFSQASCLKLIIEIEKLARLGLTIGGQRPQAYIVPFKDQPVSIPSADGYKFIVTSGKTPLFKTVDLFKIYKDDKFELDESNGIFKKLQTTGADFENETLNNFVGFVFVGIMNDGIKIVRKITKDTIEHHRKFSKFSDGKIWNQHYMRMAQKTAMKHVLRDFIYVCEGLANLADFEGDQHEKSNDEKSIDIEVNQFSEGVEIIEEKPAEVVENKNQDIGDII